MAMVVIGKADRNWTVEQLMNERSRHGAEYLDLATGNLLNVVADTPTPIETGTGEEPEEPEEEPVKKKKKK